MKEDHFDARKNNKKGNNYPTINKTESVIRKLKRHIKVTSLKALINKLMKDEGKNEIFSNIHS
jgi:uncharacterized protein (DUF2267 family)